MFKTLSLVLKRVAATSLPSEIMLATAIVVLSLSSLSSAGLSIQ
jgi:hypothetical protein